MQQINEAIWGVEPLQMLNFRTVGMRRVDHFPIMILTGC